MNLDRFELIRTCLDVLDRDPSEPETHDMTLELFIHDIIVTILLPDPSRTGIEEVRERFQRELKKVIANIRLMRRMDKDSKIVNKIQEHLDWRNKHPTLQNMTLTEYMPKFMALYNDLDEMIEEYTEMQYAAELNFNAINELSPGYDKLKIEYNDLVDHNTKLQEFVDETDLKNHKLAEKIRSLEKDIEGYQESIKICGDNLNERSAKVQKLNEILEIKERNLNEFAAEEYSRGREESEEDSESKIEELRGLLVTYSNYCRDCKNSHDHCFSIPELSPACHSYVQCDCEHCIEWRKEFKKETILPRFERNNLQLKRCKLCRYFKSDGTPCIRVTVFRKCQFVPEKEENLGEQ